jgi:hypothetical protein
MKGCGVDGRCGIEVQCRWCYGSALFVPFSLCRASMYELGAGAVLTKSRFLRISYSVLQPALSLPF